MTQTHPESVQRALKALPSPQALERAGALLRAVADPTRLRLLYALAGARLCVCDLTEVCGQSLSATSHQLRYLREAHLVRFEKVGRMVYYELADHHVRDLLSSALEHALEETLTPAPQG